MTKARDNATQGGLTLISNTSFSAVSEVIVNNLLAQSKYKLICSFANTSNSGNYFRLRKNSADVSSAYTGASFYTMYNNTTGNDNVYNSGTTTWLGYGSITFNYELVTSSSTNAATVTGLAYDANYGRARFTSFETSGTNDVTGFRFYPQAGTITGSLTIYKYN